MNPEKMRSDYGKLVYMLQDSTLSEIETLLEFSCNKSVETVYRFLETRGSLGLLKDPLIMVATQAIIDDKRRPRYEIQRSIKMKENAVEQLASKYCNSRLSRGDIKLCLRSIGDNNSFLVGTRDPVDKMIHYLTTFFRPDHIEDAWSLAISYGRGGARLSHDHTRQYHYVLQSLTLWREVLNDMFKLWILAEEDLLDPSNRYRLTNTGQGLNRVQAAPRVSSAMHRLLHQVQRNLSNWIGSSVIHLGDHNVPNALMFIDKYTQITRIINPVLLTVEQLDQMALNDGLRQYMDSTFGGKDRLRLLILQDFFRHAFDGSGADNFFDAGSCLAAGTLVTCIDGLSRPIEEINDCRVLFGWEAVSEQSVANVDCIASTRRISSEKRSFSSESERFQVRSGGSAGLVLAHALPCIDQGWRKTLRITLYDGRSLCCTSDHLLLAEGSRWLEAGELRIFSDRLLCGLDAPCDLPRSRPLSRVPFLRCLKVDGFCFLLFNLKERDRLLSFVRLLGFVFLSETLHEGHVLVDHPFDAERLLADVSRVLDLPRSRLVNPQRILDRTSLKNSSMVVELPQILVSALLGVQRCPQKWVWSSFEQRENFSYECDLHSSTIPAFLMSATCPVEVVREFVSGLFGGPFGVEPLVYCRQELESKSFAELSPIQLEVKNVLPTTSLSLLIDVKRLLCRVGLRKRAVSIGFVPKSRSFNRPQNKTSSNNDRVLFVWDVLRFGELIGFRYCVAKELSLSLAMSFWRRQESITRALHDYRMMDQFSSMKPTKFSTSLESLMITCRQLKKSPLLLLQLLQQQRTRIRKDLIMWEDPAAFFTTIDCLEWLRVGSKTRIAFTFSRRIPCFALPVIAIGDAGVQHVFDLGVPSVNCFLANGVVAHNCIDGRLTSAWNWCENLPKKSYYPIFKLSGFSGFDGDFQK